MDPLELWWLVEAKKPTKYYAFNSLTEQDVAELYEDTYGDG